MEKLIKNEFMNLVFMFLLVMILIKLIKVILMKKLCQNIKKKVDILLLV